MAILFGLLLLASYTTAETPPYQFKSAPSCPTENGEVWLLDEENNCHKVDTQGPCGTNMLFFPHPNKEDKIHGFCDCFDARMYTEEEQYFINDKDLSHCIQDMRSQIYVPERNRCYSAFGQGPCPDGKWLVLNETNYPICAKNHCSLISDPMTLRFTFSHSSQDKCYETMTRGYCPKSYKLRFAPNDWIPRCKYTPTVKNKSSCSLQSVNKGISSAEVVRSRCKPGSRRDYLSNCSQSVNPR